MIAASTRRRSKFACGTVLAAAALTVVAPARASDASWAEASSIGRDILFGAALGVPAVQRDWNGDLQAVGSVGIAAGGAWALKEAFPEERPDGSDRKSFPSGHTAESFAAAAMLEKRYGWRAGAPALALATFVGLARVEARKHHWYDVAAGAALGGGGAWLVTARRDRQVRLLPWSSGDGGGLALSGRF